MVAVHGFPLDWNLWPINAWPDKIAEIEAVTDKPVWVTEVGVGSFGAEEVQVFGVNRTAELLIGRVPRIYWYSLYDLPHGWGAETRHREAEGSSYYRHFYMGLIREDGTPKPALDDYAAHRRRDGADAVVPFRGSPAGRGGRLDEAARRAASCAPASRWADSFRPNAIDWFDRQMEALADFEVTVTFCFTPEHLGRRAAPHQPAARAAGVRRFLRVDDRALCPARDRRGSRRDRLKDTAHAQASPRARSASPSSASAIAPARWCRGCALPAGAQRPDRADAC